MRELQPWSMMIMNPSGTQATTQKSGSPAKMNRLISHFPFQTTIVSFVLVGNKGFIMALNIDTGPSLCSIFLQHKLNQIIHQATCYFYVQF